MQNVPEEWREEHKERGSGRTVKHGDGEMAFKRKGDYGNTMKNVTECSNEEMKRECKENGETGDKESLMMELTRLVQKMVKESSWWERRGIDCSILAGAFLFLPPGKKLHTVKTSFSS